MKAWLSRTQLRQRPSLAVYTGLLITIMVVTVAIALKWLSSAAQDRIGVIANFLSLGTLLLALVAGIVALAAYSAATGRPRLKLQLRMSRTLTNTNKILILGGVRKENIFRISIKNTTGYAARTPAVIIDFYNCSILPQSLTSSPEWKPVNYDPEGQVLGCQWDGGPNNAIRGNSTRHLPELDLGWLKETGPGPKMII
jgi:hypothetical protein